MDESAVRTLEELHEALQAAVELELATIPPYLCAWWTIRDRSGDVALMLQEVAISEMRHLAIAANTLIATGGTPEIRCAVPTFPTAIRNVVVAEVSLLPFGTAFLEQSLLLERPDPERARSTSPAPSSVPLLAMGDRFPTIGAFYRHILEGLDRLVARLGEAAVFPDGGRTGRQLRYFGAQRVDVSCHCRAQVLMEDIVAEGEGEDREIGDDYGDLAHYYKLDQMRCGKRYRPGDKGGSPSGDELAVPKGDDHVAPMVPNPRQALYPEGSALWDDSAAFNQLFAEVVDSLDAGFKGEPAKVQVSLGQMLQLREAADRLFVHAVPGRSGFVAGPTFELSAPR